MGHDNRAMPSNPSATDEVQASKQGRRLLRMSKSQLEAYCEGENIPCSGLTKADMILAMRKKAREEKVEKEPEEEAETGYIYWE